MPSLIGRPPGISFTDAMRHGTLWGAGGALFDRRQTGVMAAKIPSFLIGRPGAGSTRSGGPDSFVFATLPPSHQHVRSSGVTARLLAAPDDGEKGGGPPFDEADVAAAIEALVATPRPGPVRPRPAESSHSEAERILARAMIDRGIATGEELRDWWNRTVANPGFSILDYAVDDWRRKNEEAKLLGLRDLMREVFKIDFVDIGKIDMIVQQTLGLIRPEIARSCRAIPLQRVEKNKLRVVLADPLNHEAMEQLRKVLPGVMIVPLFGFPDDVDRKLAEFYPEAGVRPVTATDQPIAAPRDDDEGTEPPPAAVGQTRQVVSAEEADASDSKVVKFTADLIANAFKRRASDIHIEPTERGLMIRLRIDGVLEPLADEKDEREQQLWGWIRRNAGKIVGRLMVMSRLDLDKKDRSPQSGAFQQKIAGRDIDVRVQSHPTVLGPSMVLRLLDRHNVRSLDTLGLLPEQIDIIRAAIARGSGLLLTAGPTGSGKSSTLASFLREMDRHRLKIVTAEDPVEYSLEGVQQTQINVKAGLTFAESIRSFMRMDPDVIMVGEIRDRETAEMAVNAALTGHLVLSSVHTNSALETVQRLLQLGMPGPILLSILRAVIWQTLVLKNCEACKRPVQADESLTRVVDTAETPGPFYRGTGLRGEDPAHGVTCVNCRGKGYSGRVGIYEVIPGGPVLSGYIEGRRAREETEGALRGVGIPLLREASLQHLQAGSIAPETFLEILALREQA